MTIERNVEGLRNNAQKKHQEALDKVDKGIKQLLKERKAVNFNTVAQASGVSKAWLYKEPKIKAQIESLRENHSKSEKLPTKQRTSDASKDAIIKTLRERIKKLEAENREWREQNEVAYGRILQMSELEDRIERLETENARLKKELSVCQSQVTKDSASVEHNVVTLSRESASGKISATIKEEIKCLGIKLTDTLASKIHNSEEIVVLNAIGVVKQQMGGKKAIKSPAGLLYDAIDNKWELNQPLCENKPSDFFAQWYDLARVLGIVIGSRKDDDGIMWVQDTTRNWFLFEDFSSKWTIEYLRSKVKK